MPSEQSIAKRNDGITADSSHLILYVCKRMISVLKFWLSRCYNMIVVKLEADHTVVVQLLAPFPLRSS